MLPGNECYQHRPFNMAHVLCFKHQQEAPENLDTGPMLKIFPGQAFPLGVSEVDNGINFAIFSQHATSVTLCLSLDGRCVSNLLCNGIKIPAINVLL